MLSSKYWITNCILLTILAFSTFVPALAFAAPLDNSEKNWLNMNGNTWAWNYSPETQINKDNVQNLEVKWIFPISSIATSGPKGYVSLQPGDGSSTPPLVKNGKVYITTNYQMVIALDGKTGKQLWKNSYDINITQAVQRLPLTPATFGGVHNHGFRYWETGNALINRGIACDFYGVDADTGKTSFWVQDLCKDIPGNLYKYNTVYAGAKSGSIGIYEKGNQFIYVLSGAVHSSLSAAGDGRHVTMGIDTTTKNILWRVFSAPPQDVPTKDWALQECNIGYFQTFPCSDVAAKNKAGLEWDWALPDAAPVKWAGVTANWGQLVVDEDTGIVYTNTGNQGPYSNMSMTPGPRLYGSTIMAIDMNSGKRIWWLQPFPHDPYDYDCNWSGILADVKGLGKIYMKGCKEGILYAMDAKTGKPVWTADVVKEQVKWGQVQAAAAVPQPNGIRAYQPDPYSLHDMREWNWISYPAAAPGQAGERCNLPCGLYPHWSNGLFGTDLSYDPDTNTLFQYASGQQVTLLKENSMKDGASLMSTRGYSISNSTIVARDAATGNVKWTWFYKFSTQRSHLVVTSDMLLTGFTDGYMRFFDKSSGKLLREMNVGTHMVNGFSTGQDSDGKQKLFGVIGVGDATSSRVYPSPTAGGAVIALGLSENPAGAAQQTTTTVTTTSATTITTATTSTVTTTSATTVTSATTNTVTTTKAATTTVTTSAPAQTITSQTTVTSQITQTQTETSGLPAEVTYAAVGVAVIAIAAAAVLVMRKK
ncbi:MAG: PQQ-binding-like beta-propeller repeat protein [Thaumarchaeota archaeon]|nr:PQQ-binding-like beta-propeller repeat protein [Nitrososphaerota archaeon]